MAFSGKHQIVEIEGIRCTLVEAGIPESRMLFLKKLLEYNKYDVRVLSETKEDKTAFTVGVTSIVFNPVIAVYEKSLLTPEGKRITPDYWNQKTTNIIPYYWINI